VDQQGWLLRRAQSPGVLSSGQWRLWFVDQLLGSSPAYNIVDHRRFVGGLDVGALGAAVGEVVARHESLRTSFVEVDGEPVQRVGGVGRWVLEVVDVVGGEEEVRRLAGAEALVPFDLGRGPLLRTRLLRLGVEDHVLLVTMHHIVSDGWSLGVFWGEVGVLYRAFAAGEGSPLGVLPVQYGDFAVWQREWLSGERLEGLLGYWRERLAGAPGVLELPVDRVRPAVQGFAGGEVGFVLPAGVGVGLRGVARERRATLFMVLLAAFKVVLVRYTGQCDVVVGTPIAGRNREELEGLIGFFVNTLVLRTDCSGDPVFGELVGRVRETAIGAYSHQDLPFERLVEELHPVRDLSRNPLVQLNFQLLNLQEETRVQPVGDSPEAGPDDAHSSRFDLEVYIWERGDVLDCQFVYARELFDADTVERFAGHFRNVLECVSSAPQTRLSRVAMLSQDERDQLVVGWNATSRDFPARCVHELFEEQVARSPDAVAVEFGDQALSYAQLNTRANQVAHRLRRAGVGPDVLVGICLERSLEMVAGLLGILKAGGAYVPLDPDYPSRRLEFMLADTAAGIVVTSEGLAPLFPGRRTVILPPGGALAGEPGHNPGRQAHPANLAYVIYTSGSTGQPKGVAVPHTGVTNYLLGLIEKYALSPGDCIPQISSISFDASMRDILGPLFTGGKLAIVRAAAKHGVDAIVEDLIRVRATRILSIVPTLLRQLLTDQRLAELTSLRLLLISGEALTYTLTERARAALPACTVVNQYGPTETTMTSTRYVAGETRGEMVPVGEPIQNVRIYLLDSAFNPVPVGVVGDVYIAGSGVTRGYFGLAGKTGESYVADPFAVGGRMYRTGDLAKRLARGELYFAGRQDQQVKVSGNRIEPGEIESVLAQCPGIRDAAVVPRGDGEHGTVLTVALLPGDDWAGLRSVLQFLEDRLPDYMIPMDFHLMDSLPLTANGKVDRAGIARHIMNAQSEPPRKPAPGLEQTIAEVWCSVLELREVSATADFLDLGGQSLTMMRVASRLKRRLQRDVSMEILLTCRTVAELAQALGGPAGAVP
jgi:pristinamycin I synthase 3 and 4